MMAMDLGKQHLWVQKREEWFQKRQAALLKRGIKPDPHRRIVLDDGIEITKDGKIESSWHVPFPILFLGHSLSSRSHSNLHLLSSSSFSSIKSTLLSPLLDPVSALLAPTSLALLHFRNALSNGSLHHLGTRAWEKAWSPDPMILAMKVVKRVWKKEDGEDESDGDGDMEG